MRIFDETKLNRAGMKVLEEEIRETFRGKTLNVWERGFDATSVVRENLFFYEEETFNAHAHEAPNDHFGIRVETKIGYEVLSLTFREDLGEPEPLIAFTARFESGDDDPVATWLGPDTLVIKNRRRPINAKVPIKELYISVTPMP